MAAKVKELISEKAVGATTNTRYMEIVGQLVTDRGSSLQRFVTLFTSDKTGETLSIGLVNPYAQIALPFEMVEQLIEETRRTREVKE